MQKVCKCIEWDAWQRVCKSDRLSKGKLCWHRCDILLLVPDDAEAGCSAVLAMRNKQYVYRSEGAWAGTWFYMRHPETARKHLGAGAHSVCTWSGGS